jgi:DNA-binding Lrp family transcriptional regulator
MIKLDTEARILTTIQWELPMVLASYEAIANQADIEVKQLLSILREWKANGKLRRIDTAVNHFKANLYTMVHAANTEQLHQTVEAMSEAVNAKDFVIRFTEKELKKVPSTYILN